MLFVQSCFQQNILFSLIMFVWNWYYDVLIFTKLSERRGMLRIPWKPYQTYKYVSGVFNVLKSITMISLSVQKRCQKLRLLSTFIIFTCGTTNGLLALIPVQIWSLHDWNVILWRVSDVLYAHTRNYKVCWAILGQNRYCKVIVLLIIPLL